MNSILLLFKKIQQLQWNLITVGIRLYLIETLTYHIHVHVPLWCFSHIPRIYCMIATLKWLRKIRVLKIVGLYMYLSSGSGMLPGQARGVPILTWPLLVHRWLSSADPTTTGEVKPRDPRSGKQWIHDTMKQLKSFTELKIVGFFVTWRKMFYRQ